MIEGVLSRMHEYDLFSVDDDHGTHFLDAQMDYGKDVRSRLRFTSHNANVDIFLRITMYSHDVPMITYALTQKDTSKLPTAEHTPVPTRGLNSCNIYIRPLRKAIRAKKDRSHTMVFFAMMYALEELVKSQDAVANNSLIPVTFGSNIRLDSLF